MWQWIIQSPLLSASRSIERDCMWAIRTVSLRSPEGSAKVCPCKCNGWLIIVMLVALIRSRCPAVTVSCLLYTSRCV